MVNMKKCRYWDQCKGKKKCAEGKGCCKFAKKKGDKKGCAVCIDYTDPCQVSDMSILAASSY